VATAFTARFGAKATFDVAHQAEEEIKTLVESAQESGAIEDDEKELLHSVFEFTDTVAREIMTPRVDLDAVSIHTDPGEIVKLIQESGHSRIPIYEDTDDQIIGIIHAKDILLATLEKNGQVNLRELLRPALFVPEGKNLHELLAEMKSARSQLAIVQDEFGGTAGIVTMEDIVEELVGDIQDEYDEEEPAIVEEEGFYLVEGRTHLDDVNAILGSQFESETFDTIGGYVFGLFGRQPKESEGIEENGYRFAVVETDGRRIVRLRISRVPEVPLLMEEDEESLDLRRSSNG
jgi:putative hemolysin